MGSFAGDLGSFAGDLGSFAGDLGDLGSFFAGDLGDLGCFGGSSVGTVGSVGSPFGWRSDWRNADSAGWSSVISECTFASCSGETRLFLFASVLKEILKIFKIFKPILKIFQNNSTNVTIFKTFQDFSRFFKAFLFTEARGSLSLAAAAGPPSPVNPPFIVPTGPVPATVARTLPFRTRIAS